MKFNKFQMILGSLTILGMLSASLLMDGLNALVFILLMFFIPMFVVPMVTGNFLAHNFSKLPIFWSILIAVGAAWLIGFIPTLLPMEALQVPSLGDNIQLEIEQPTTSDVGGSAFLDLIIPSIVYLVLQSITYWLVKTKNKITN